MIYRMGSTSPTTRPGIEINSINGCRISSDKILMKKAFDEVGINTAEWFTIPNREVGRDYIKKRLYRWGCPIIAKKFNSSKGNGIYLIKSIRDFLEIPGDITRYVFEKYYNYTKEYRLHVSCFGCFYTSRKMLRNDADIRWHRHSNNSVFINESNPQFDKPRTWNKIVKQCQDIIKHIGLDIAAFDVKVSRSGEFIILESNSAPSLKEQGIEKYTTELKKIIDYKTNGRI